MNREDLIQHLRRNMVETGSLVCLGCGLENSCSARGCRILREAADQLAMDATLMECKDDEIAKLREAVDRQAEELEFLRERVKLDKQTILTIGQSLEKAAGEVKHARWEKSQYGGYSVCSACRDVYVGESWVDAKKWNYCPGCGATMDKDGAENG